MAIEDARFVLNLDIDTEIFQEHILNTRFDIARKILNRTKYILNENLKKMKNDINYIFWLKDPKSKTRTENLNAIRESYDLSKSGAERIVKNIAKEYVRQTKIAKRPKKKMKKILPDGSVKLVRKKRKREETEQPHIDSATAQALSEQAWEAIESVMFKNGKSVHYKKIGQLNSIRSKSNVAGIRYVGNGTLEWNGLIMRVKFDKNDKYAEKAMHHDISYCRIVRKMIRGKYKFYLQLVLKGIPPQKHKRGTGKVSFDIGTSTLATYSKNNVRLVEFCEGLDELQKEKRRLQRKLDRSSRVLNPNNYDINGVVKKDAKKWIRSKSYYETLFKLKDICRVIAAKREMMHNKLANEVLSEGDEVYSESMNYKGMQKGIFGKKIGHKAPSKFLRIVDKKLKYDGKELNKINTWKVKASQYDPYSDTYKKKKLSERMHLTGDGYVVQRDCFSAFLIYHVGDRFDSIDRETCLKDFQNFYSNYLKLFNELKLENKKRPVSMGI